MLIRGSSQCNLNSVDIYCQGVLIHRHPLLHGLTQHQRAAGSGERHAAFTVLLADSPRDCWRDRRHTTPQPIGHNSQMQWYSPVECHIYRLCPLSTETPSDCISEDVPLPSSHVTTGKTPCVCSVPLTVSVSVALCELCFQPNDLAENCSDVHGVNNTNKQTYLLRPNSK